MKCPVDGETLVMMDRGGVEIDYCPACRGVWLDRGELDKIIERSIGGTTLPEPSPAPAPAPKPRPEPHVYQEPYREEARQSYKKGKPYKRKSKGKRALSLLEELFDFD